MSRCADLAHDKSVAKRSEPADKIDLGDTERDPHIVDGTHSPAMWRNTI
jgi:hypothetical protein